MRKARMWLVLAGVVMWAISAPIHGAMQRIAVVDCADNEICFYVWPKLPALKGWHADEDASYESEVNMLVPDGFTAKNADAAIYAEATNKAAYQKNNPDTTTLGGYIADDQGRIRKDVPDVEIAETASLLTGDGEKLRTFQFAHLKGDHCRIVAYGEEDDYYIIFVIDAGSADGLKKNMDAYKSLVLSYTAGSEAERHADPNKYTVIVRHN